MTDRMCSCCECVPDYPEPSDEEIEEAQYILKLLYMHMRNQWMIEIYEADGDFL